MREDEYKKLHEENMKRVNEMWERKMREERKRWDTMRTLKFQKA